MYAKLHAEEADDADDRHGLDKCYDKMPKGEENRITENVTYSSMKLSKE